MSRGPTRIEEDDSDERRATRMGPAPAPSSSSACIVPRQASSCPPVPPPAPLRCPHSALPPPPFPPPSPNNVRVTDALSESRMRCPSHGCAVRVTDALSESRLRCPSRRSGRRRYRRTLRGPRTRLSTGRRRQRRRRCWRRERSCRRRLSILRKTLRNAIRVGWCWRRRLMIHGQRAGAGAPAVRLLGPEC